MRTIRIFGYEIGIELWVGLADFRHWRLGRERWAGSEFGERLYWFGPLHLATAHLSR